MVMCCFSNEAATTDIYTYWHTLTLHDDLPVLRGKGADAAPHRAAAGEGEANHGIGGAGDRTEQVGRDDADFMPRAAQLADRRLQCADDAVDQLGRAHV